MPVHESRGRIHANAFAAHHSTRPLTVRCDVSESPPAVFRAMLVFELEKARLEGLAIVAGGDA